MRKDVELEKNISNLMNYYFDIENFSTKELKGELERRETEQYKQDYKERIFLSKIERIVKKVLNEKEAAKKCEDDFLKLKIKIK